MFCNNDTRVWGARPLPAGRSVAGRRPRASGRRASPLLAPSRWSAVSDKPVSVQALVGTMERVKGPVDPKELWVRYLQGKVGTPPGAGMCEGAAGELARHLLPAQPQTK